jgi:hypothetical protein
MAMMAITTSNSIRVNAPLSRDRLSLSIVFALSVFIGGSLLAAREAGGIAPPASG